MRRMMFVGVAAAALLLMTATAPGVDARSSAAGGKGGGTVPSIALDQSNPQVGDAVTFTTSGGSRISVACYQGGLGNMVYSADQATGTAFVLASPQWQPAGGDALCYAWLYTRSLSRGALASTSFTVGVAP